MRKLGLKDAFALARILKAANLRNEIVGFANEITTRKKSGNKVNLNDVGLEFVLTLITSASSSDVEKKIYELYADIKGCTAEEVSMADFTTLKADIAEIIDINDLKAFFRSASALT